MKKIFDRRTLAFILVLISLDAIAASLSSDPVKMAVLPLIIGAQVTLVMAMLGANVTENSIKNKFDRDKAINGAPDVPTPVGPANAG